MVFKAYGLDKNSKWEFKNFRNLYEIGQEIKVGTQKIEFTEACSLRKFSLLSVILSCLDLTSLGNCAIVLVETS